MKKIPFFLILIYIFAVIAVQLGLSTGSVREVFTNIDALEGLSNSQIIDTVGTAEIELEMVNFTPENRLRILVNGKVSAYFYKPRIRLAVKNNSLIEIDSTQESKNYTVIVSDVSANVEPYCAELVVTTQNNIAILGKIFVK